MPKTIAVVDEQGNTYEATYPKRARGLVKKGRARFVSESMICLVRPPKLEEKRMSTTVTIEKIFEQLNKIVDSNEFFERALHTLASMTSANIPTDSYAPGDIAGQARAQAVADICKQRETTNQQLIRFYEKMYDDMMYMQGLRREQPMFPHKKAFDERQEVPPMPEVPPVNVQPPVVNVQVTPPMPDIPEFPDMPDIPMIPPV